MASSLKDSLRHAFAAIGQALPSKLRPVGQPILQPRAKDAAEARITAASPKTGSVAPPASGSQASTPEIFGKSTKARATPILLKDHKSHAKRTTTAKARPSATSTGTAPATEVRRSETPLAVPAATQFRHVPTYPAAGLVRLELARQAKLTLATDDRPDEKFIEGYIRSGHLTQCHAGYFDSEREVVMGLDFGTSCIKTVIGDSALGQAFAVPFCEGAGIVGYLLPCRLHESDGQYALSGHGRLYRDLKLALLAAPTDSVNQERVIAMLALVIRHARGWLFSAHADIYRNVRIRWKLVVGLPVAHHLEGELSNVFGRLAHIAWLLAGQDGEIDQKGIRDARHRLAALDEAPGLATEDEDIVVDVIPEIAAQIYGFVNSQYFDRKANNICLMVDIGAGTVDSSLFLVRPRRAGRWDFEFYTSIVQPHGVMNLHRHRINWWKSALHDCPDPRAKNLSDSLNAVKFPTDRLTGLPESYRDYFDGIGLDFDASAHEPDEEFFRRKIVQQVRGKTYWRAWKDQFLQQIDLTDIPAFYCGGGVRMSYYHRLGDELRAMPGATWLRATPRRLEIPSNLGAPGLKREDYDRLSVAYGLSLLEVGKVVKALPKPRVELPQQSSWQENYVDKDQC